MGFCFLVSGDAVRRLGTIIQSIFCAQSGASIRLTLWKWSGESRYAGALPPVLENFRRAFCPGRTDCPWVSEDEMQWTRNFLFFLVNHFQVLLLPSYVTSEAEIACWYQMLINAIFRHSTKQQNVPFSSVFSEFVFASSENLLWFNGFCNFQD